MTVNAAYRCTHGTVRRLVTCVHWVQWVKWVHWVYWDKWVPGELN